jgi:orotate phosphoribosyltransferase
MTDRARLLELLKRDSVFHGDFILASGERSNIYVDCRITTMNPEAAILLGQVMYAGIREALGVRTPVSVGGLTMGADPVALAVGIASWQMNPSHSLKVFAVRKQAKDHGKGRRVEGNFKAGDHVVVVDDVITSGKSTLQAIEAIQAEGGIVDLVACLVDRESGGREKITALGLEFISVFSKVEVFGS